MPCASGVGDIIFSELYPFRDLKRSLAPTKPPLCSVALIGIALRGGGALMRIGLVAAAICLSVVGLAAADDVKAAIRKDTSIPAGGLGPALQTLAKEYNFQVLYRTEVVGSLRTEGAVGQFTSEEALKQLLRGTGLTYRYLDDKTITIMPLSGGGAGVSASPSDNPAATRNETQNEGKTAASGPFLLAQASSTQTASSASVEPQRKAEMSEVPLQEVIVTAQKREERLLEVPQSVTVVSAEDLARNGDVQFRDFANSVPGLTYSTAGAGFTQISLRGVTAGLDVGPTVRVYVDEVPYGSSGNSAFTRGERLALDVGLFDLDRIEVLEGPQGTLYGASSMGGVLKYVTRQPDLDRFGVVAQTGASETQDGGVSYNGAATVNAPIVAATAALRMTGFYSRDGGYIDNLALNESDVSRSSVYGGRLDFLIKPTDSLTVRLSGYLQNVSRDGMGTVDDSAAGVPLYGALDQRRLFPEPFEQAFRLVSGTIAYNFGPATLTSVSSYQSVHSQVNYDISPALASLPPAYGGPFSLVGEPEDVSTDKFTQELRLASASGGVLEWLVGAFYTHEDSNRVASLVLRDLSGTPVANDLFNSLTPSTYAEYAGFGDLTWHITSKIDVTGGLRYADDRQSAAQNGNGLFVAPFATTHSSENELTYLGDARYHFSDQAIAYVRYATGYRPGGPNFVEINPSTGAPSGPATFSPDRLVSYEIGFKSETQDQRYALNVAAYFIDWKNMQVFDITSPFGGLTNAPAARLPGAELGFAAHPLDGLTLTGAFTYENAYLTAPSADLGASQGAHLPDVPHFTGTLAADYAFAQTGLKPTVGGAVHYMTQRSPGFGEPFELPAYATLDLHGALTFGPVQTQLYLRNVFNKYAELSAYFFSGEPQTTILQPRTVGLNLTARF